MDETLRQFMMHFHNTFSATLNVFLIYTAAAVLLWCKVISSEHIKGLARVTVNVFLPCLIFSTILAKFDPHATNFWWWWLLPVASFALTGFGLLLAFLALGGKVNLKRNVLALCSMQNGGYFVLPVAQFLFPERFDTFALYAFLFFLGLNPTLWSLGKFLTTSHPEEKARLVDLITPPFVASVAAVVLVYLGVQWYIPDGALSAATQLGRAAIPSANFILGGILGSIAFRIRPYIADAVRVVLIKLIVIALAMVLLLKYTGLGASNDLLTSFFILQASAPPATTLIVAVRNYGGDEQKIGSIMMVSYGLCLLTIPAWLAIWNMIR